MGLASSVFLKIKSARSNIFWGVGTLVLGCAIFFIIQPITVQRLAHAQIKATPFTLHLDVYDYSENPQGNMFIKQIVARRSDGATVRVNNVFASVGLQAGETMRKILLLDGREFTVFDGISSVIRFPQMPAKTLAIQKDKILNPPANCILPGETLAGYDTVQGHRTAMVKWPRIGEKQVIVWEASDLGCETLQTRVEEQQPNGSMKLITEAKLIELSLGEPDSTWFDVPETYTSVMPSQAMKGEADHLGVTWTVQMQEEASRNDAAYLRRASPLQ